MQPHITTLEPPTLGPEICVRIAPVMGRRDYSEWTCRSNSIFRLLQSFEKDRLGPLEQLILSVLWRRGSTTVWEAIEDGGIRREYTTVMTTLDRLRRKGLLDRTVEPKSRAFRYFPRHRTEAEWVRERAMTTLKEVLCLDTSARVPLSYLVEAIAEHDAGLLDELLHLVNEQRNKLRDTH